MTITRQVSPMN